MSGKLNNCQRDAFVKAVMQDIPMPPDEVIKKEAQDALVKAMSPTCRKLYKENPEALAGERVYDIIERSNVYFVVGDANLDEVLAPFRQRMRDRQKVATKLRQAIYACSTLKQAKERLPEFIKYLPTEREAVMNLPAVVGLVGDLKALGWKEAA